MRKVIVSEMITLDGFFAGSDGDINWHMVDEDFYRLAFDLLSSVGTLLFGRVTYELMVGYWPTEAAQTSDPAIAEKMNTLPKVVFSKTLRSVEWGEWKNARLAKGDRRRRNRHLETRARKGSGVVWEWRDRLSSRTSWFD